MRKTGFLIVVLLSSGMLGAICTMTSQVPAVRGDSSLPLLFDVNNAYQAVADQLNFGYRIPGYNASRNCANYFKTQLVPYTKVTDYNVTLHGVLCQDVVGMLNPLDDQNIVILAAHYDSRATTNDVPSQPCPGANNGGSGCAVLLELARDLYQIRDKLNTQIWFVFFDAEDQGQDQYGVGLAGWNWAEGSQAFTNNLPTFLGSVPVSAVKLMVLLDMVGGISLQFTKDSSSNSKAENIFYQVGQNLGYTAAFPPNPYYFDGLLDDHVWFAQMGIPSVDLIIDFTDSSAPWHFHHTTGDTLAEISVDSLATTGRTVESFFHEYYVNATEGGGGMTPTWDQSTGNPFTESSATLISLLIGACGAAGIILTYKVVISSPKKPEILNEGENNLTEGSRP